MMSPLPNPTPSPDRPELPRARLDVRTGPGRTASYDVEVEEFLIGGAVGCNLRLSGQQLPPVICQITRKPDGVRARRVASALPVLLNDRPLPGNTPTLLSHNDRLTVAGVEIVVGLSSVAILTPRFVSLDAESKPPEPAPLVVRQPLPLPGHLVQDNPAERLADLDRREAEIVRRQRELDRQTEDLEADRALWSQRRHDLERELTHTQQELTSQRDQFNREFQQRHSELDRAEELVRTAAERLQDERTAFEAEQARRRAECDAEITNHRARLEEFQQARGVYESDFAERVSRAESEALERYRAKSEDLDRFQESLRESAAKLAQRQEEFEAELTIRRKQIDEYAAERMRLADEETTRRRAALNADLAAHEPKSADLATQQGRLRVALQDLDRQREAFAADREILDRARESFEAERAAEADRLASWQTQLADQEAELARRDGALRAERESFDRDRQQVTDDLLRLDRRRAEAEDRDRALEARISDTDLRVEQLHRDVAEWEETIGLAAAEQDRLRTEADRLARQKAELDTQTAKLGERSAQLESQQAVLAVLRARLDRTREEVEREATALAAARAREEEAQTELRARIGEAERLRAELYTVHETTAQERRQLQERDSLLAAGLEEIRVQKEGIAAEEARLAQRERDLDLRSAEFAEQAGAMKGRMAQALDLQARLEADRVAIREREAALAQAEDARQALQEQLRRRADDLTIRAKAIDEMARQLAADRSAAEHAQTDAEARAAVVQQQVEAARQAVEVRGADLERQATEVAGREAALARQVVRVKEVGRAVAEERKGLAEARGRWETDRTTAEADARAAREELETFRERVAAEIAALRAEAPELEGQAKAALDRLTTAKDTLRGHLTELNAFAQQSRADLESVRAQVRAEADRLRSEEAALDKARAEHRLAVAGFRQQLVDWQAKVAEMRRGLAHQESRLEAKQAAVEEAARQVEVTSQQQAEQAEQLRRDQEAVVQKRTEVELHLADMREWYRKKLRQLAQTNADSSIRIAEFDPPPEAPIARPTSSNDAPAVAGSVNLAPRAAHPHAEDLDPGDRQLGELLRSLELVDSESLTALWAEAGRQRRTLRQVLLASGTITLYQLALIEAGNLDGLMLGRLRVIDRLRIASPREAIYRVLDPARMEGKAGGVFMLRHLSEAEMQDAVHPDEFRQRFAATRDAAHPNLAAVVEVLEINGRPAVLQEWLTGLFSADWPTHAAHPGCWVRLMTMAAGGIDVAHRAGLVHGRLTSDAFVLTASGVLKVTGFGEPPWLSVGPAPSTEPTPATDLRALGQVAFGWSQLAAKKKGGRAAKPFPAELVGVIRRLEADAESPMGDTVASVGPYTSAADLLADLNRIARETPFSDDAWDKLLRHVTDNAPDAPAGLKQSA